MDKSAPIIVAQNTLVTSVTSAILAGIYGSFKGEGQALLLSASAAMNSGIAGATFFSIREYVVSPALVSTLPWKQYTRRLREIELDLLQSKDVTQEPLTWRDMRTHRLLDSAISGAVSGGVLNALKRGSAGIVPGLRTGAVFCTALQWGFNELWVARVKYTARRLHAAGTLQSPPQTKVPEPLTEPPRSMAERVLSGLGFHKISDEVYLARLKKTREKYLERIRQLEREAEEGRWKSP